mmetsp:Transcript_37702/g.88175  ORF Transcript_37702/g.88175 Transcript_37702/m.88175 type:complete len:282 (+) Transcript_37702:1981-2826(+)
MAVETPLSDEKRSKVPVLTVPMSSGSLKLDVPPLGTVNSREGDSTARCAFQKACPVASSAPRKLRPASPAEWSLMTSERVLTAAVRDFDMRVASCAVVMLAPGWSADDWQKLLTEALTVLATTFTTLSPKDWGKAVTPLAFVAVDMSATRLSAATTAVAEFSQGVYTQSRTPWAMVSPCAWLNSVGLVTCASTADWIPASSASTWPMRWDASRAVPRSRIVVMKTPTLVANVGASPPDAVWRMVVCAAAMLATCVESALLLPTPKSPRRRELKALTNTDET